jgi:site-specific recombinase XerD
LWAVNGRHEFVFRKKVESFPGAAFVRFRLPAWLERAGVNTEGRNITPRSARHSLASTLEAGEAPLRYIQELPGHSELKTTKGHLHMVDVSTGDISGKLTDKDC